MHQFFLKDQYVVVHGRFHFFRKINYFGRNDQKWSKIDEKSNFLTILIKIDTSVCRSVCIVYLEKFFFWIYSWSWKDFEPVRLHDQIYLQVESIDLIDFLTGKQRKKSVLLFFIRCGQVCPSLHKIVRVTQRLSKSCSYTEPSRDTKIMWKKSLLALQPVTILKLILFLGVFKFCNETNGSKLQNTVQMYFLGF